MCTVATVIALVALLPCNNFFWKDILYIQSTSSFPSFGNHMIRRESRDRGVVQSVVNMCNRALLIPQPCSVHYHPMYTTIIPYRIQSMTIIMVGKLFLPVKPQRPLDLTQKAVYEDKKSGKNPEMYTMQAGKVTSGTPEQQPTHDINDFIDESVSFLYKYPCYKA